MKQSTKKILAREFLYFTVLICLGGLFFASTYGFNVQNKWKINRLEKALSVLENEKVGLEKQIQTKSKMHEQIYEEVLNSFPEYKKQDFDQEVLWRGLQEKIPEDLEPPYTWLVIDTLTSKALMNFFAQKGITSADSFVNFIEEYSYSPKEQEIIDRIGQIDELIEHNAEKMFVLLEEEELTVYERISLTIKLTGICALLLFGFRYLLYGTIWSIETLRKNE